MFTHATHGAVRGCNGADVVAKLGVSLDSERPGGRAADDSDVTCRSPLVMILSSVGGASRHH